MKKPHLLTFVLAASVVLLSAAFESRADGLRNVKLGEPVPAYRLPTVDDSFIESEALKGSVVVIVYLSAEQRSSEVAAIESAAVVQAYSADPVKLVHVTADVVQKPYFQKFRQERKLDVPLGLDADRALYGKLGLIVFPTTIIVNREGKLAHVISLSGPEYHNMLDTYVRHALGKISDDQLQEQLKSHASTEGSPKSLASAHRSAARLMREKGQLDTAKNELLKAKELDPTNADILLDLADIDLLKPDLDEADKLIQGVLDAQPNSRRAMQLKGIVLFRRDKLDEAQELLLKALVTNPDPERVHYYLARIYEKQGQAAKANEHYREALRRYLKEPE